MTHLDSHDPLSLLAAHAAQRPSDSALTHLRPGKSPRSWTWLELHAHAERARQRIQLGWPEAAIVPVFAGKSLELVALMLGAMAAGRTFPGINPKFRGPQLRQVVQACDTRHAIADSASLPVLRDSLQLSPGDPTLWYWLDDTEATPLARSSAQTLMEAGVLRHEFPTHEETTATASARQTSGKVSERPAVCLFTSGSTGTPKGVLISWADLAQRAHAECALFGLTERDVLLSVLPFSFDVGLNQLISSWVSGAHLVMLDSWLPLDILNAIERHHVTGVSGVPSIWVSLLKSPAPIHPKTNHRSWRYLTVSGGSMTPHQLQDLASRVPGVGIYKTYGQTESFRSTALEPADLLRRPQSVGRAFGSAKVYVVREDGCQADPNELGEVVHTGLGVMLGYLHAADGDQKRRVNPFFGPQDTSEFAIFTGDQGYLDEEGFLHLAGRNDDMVKISGNRVHLSELACHACALPDVVAAEAIAVNRGDDDPAIVLFVVPKSDASVVSSEDLQRRLQRLLPTYMVPKRLEILDSFPLTASGKADRPLLKQQAVVLMSATSTHSPQHAPFMSSPKGPNPCP